MTSKLPSTGTTIFTVMSKLAGEYGAINLSQGFPNFSSDPLLFELVKEYMDRGYNQYALLAGQWPLREAVSDKIDRLHGIRPDPAEEICITAGATQAIFTAVQALVHPGDEVIILDPAFDIYAPTVELCGGRPVRIPLEAPGFRVDWQMVEDHISRKTRLIMINSPHNPTGMVMTREDMLMLEKLVLHHGLYVISDEVYEHLVFDGRIHASAIRFEGLYQRTIAAFSFGKTFHNTGWKVGYAVAPPNLMDEFRKIHQFIVFSVNTPVQHALADYMSDPDTYLKLPEFHQQKRDRFLELIAPSRFTFRPSEGTYFQLLDYSAVSDQEDLDFSDTLVRKHGVAAIPLSPFYEKKSHLRVLRFCFAKTNDILESAAEKLCAI